MLEWSLAITQPSPYNTEGETEAWKEEMWGAREVLERWGAAESTG